MIAILDRFVAKCKMSINILSNDTMYLGLYLYHQKLTKIGLLKENLKPQIYSLHLLMLIRSFSLLNSNNLQFINFKVNSTPAAI